MKFRALEIGSGDAFLIEQKKKKFFLIQEVVDLKLKI